jgi:acetolactate synthase-1/2/3 large subunit
VPAALDALVAYAHRTGFAPGFDTWLGEIAALKSTFGMYYDRASPLVQPQYVMETMNRITRAKRSSRAA